ncbi:MAG TPA: hypothetical protein VMF91_16500 [Bryobacteraceae bacterium]|nr:hypothetical protein [Bryobacteraceae bacterium]
MARNTEIALVAVFKVQIEQFLVVDLGFGEQNVQFVKVLFTFFGGFAAGFGGGLKPLRFKPLAKLRIRTKQR